MLAVQNIIYNVIEINDQIEEHSLLCYFIFSFSFFFSVEFFKSFDWNYSHRRRVWRWRLELCFSELWLTCLLNLCSVIFPLNETSNRNKLNTFYNQKSLLSNWSYSFFFSHTVYYYIDIYIVFWQDITDIKHIIFHLFYIPVISILHCFVIVRIFKTSHWI
jgi:hypothetical protein